MQSIPSNKEPLNDQKSNNLWGYPLFSVAMCVYHGDQPDQFHSAVNSILSQTVPPAEVVLVVDGPVPEALNLVIQEIAKDLRFRIIRLEKNLGHSGARRESILQCQHDLVALMDADDISVSDRFEKQLAIFQCQPETSVVGGIINEFVGNIGNSVGLRVVPSNDADIYEFLKRRCPINNVTAMYRKNDVIKAGGYRDGYLEEDYYLWLRMSLGGAVFYNLNEILVHVRAGDEMYRRRGGLAFFISEVKLQAFMLRSHITNLPLFLYNVLVRLVVQVMMPNKVRGWFYRHFARKRVKPS